MGHDQAHQAAAGAVLASYVEEGETRFHCFFVSFAKQQLRGDIKSGRVNVGILAVEAVLLLQAFDDFNRVVVMPTERNIKSDYISLKSATKGQIISKAIFVFLTSPKKQTKK